MVHYVRYHLLLLLVVIEAAITKQHEKEKEEMMITLLAEELLLLSIKLHRKSFCNLPRGYYTSIYTSSTSPHSVMDIFI